MRELRESRQSGAARSGRALLPAIPAYGQGRSLDQKARLGWRSTHTRFRKMATRSVLLTLLLVLTACVPNLPSGSAAEKSIPGHGHVPSSAVPCAATSTTPLGA